MSIFAKTISCILAILLAFCLIVPGMYVLSRNNTFGGNNSNNPIANTEGESTGHSQSTDKDNKETKDDEDNKDDEETKEKVTYTITLNANGGKFADSEDETYSITVESTDEIVNFSEEIKAVSVTKEGRIFLGWSKVKTAYSYTIVNDFKLTSDNNEANYFAIWTKYDKCAVTFNAIGGYIDEEGNFVAFTESDKNGHFANAETTQAFTLNLDAANNGYYSFSDEAKQVSGNSAPTKTDYRFVGWVKCWTDGGEVKHTSTPVKYFKVSAQRNVFGYSAVWEKIEA